MNTDDFISMLARGVAPRDRWILAKRFSLAVLVGFPGAVLLVISVLGVRPDLAQAAVTPIFWAKIAFPLCLMVGALSMVMRLARPAMRPGFGIVMIGAAIAAVWGLAIYILMAAPPEARVTLILGESWRVCALNITVLSVPGFIAVFWALRGLAPTRLALTGACGGLLAGAMATSAYCLYCPEMEVPFWGFWYLLGMVVPTVVGTLLGPRWLRW
ncbi:MAG: NrsF family protein [Pseudomonas sp.]